MFLKAGADPNARGSGLPPLLLAMGIYSTHHDPTMVLQLLQAGAAVDFRTAEDYANPDDEGPKGAYAGQTLSRGGRALVGYRRSYTTRNTWHNSRVLGRFSRERHGKEGRFRAAPKV